MFRTLGLFSNIQCPNRTICTVPNCFFSHDAATTTTPVPVPIATPAAVYNPVTSTTNLPPRGADDASASVDSFENEYHSEQLLKRRKLSHDMDEEVATAINSLGNKSRDVSPSRYGTAQSTINRSMKGLLDPPNRANAVRRQMPSHDGGANVLKTTLQLKSALKSRDVPNAQENLPDKSNIPILDAVRKQALVAQRAKMDSRPISPPPSAKPKSTAPTPNSTQIKDETLNPRSLPKAPAQHSQRLQFLTFVHTELTRLNPNMNNPTGKQKLIKMALDEEESIARENSQTYAVVMKQRAFALKKMSIEQYKEAVAAKKREAQEKQKPITVDTKLAPEDEIRALSGYVASFDDLKAYGFVVVPPNQAELHEASEGLRASAGYETCDRCTSRFRVFPGRREEDGALATGGKCTFHWGKQFIPKKVAGGGQQTKVWDCCKEDVGNTIGCTTGDHHVFYVRDRKRLAVLWQYEETPGSLLAVAMTKETTDVVEKLKAICLDCEMSYTVHGLELTRVTATSFPDFETVLDLLVKPLGEILDFNTRFSGITSGHYALARPHKPGDNLPDADSNLPVVSSPEEARNIVWSLIDRSTIIIGHALDNDFNALRIIHPRVVDSATLFPVRRGPPMKNALKWLVKKYLHRDIQGAGSAGHDSKEDANSAGDLVRWRMSEDVRTGKIGMDGTWLVGNKRGLAAMLIEEPAIEKKR